MKTDKVTFTGYGARPLRALLMRDSYGNVKFESLINELSSIGKQHGFDVFVQDSKRILNGLEYKPQKAFSLPEAESENLWLQDNMTITPNGKMFAPFFSDRLNNIFSRFLKIPLTMRNYHFQGGNFFFIKDNGKTSLLIGRDEAKFGYSLEKIKQDLGVDEIYPISQPDFHIDLGIRPLKDKVVLVQDDNLTLAKLREAVKKAEIFHKESRTETSENIKFTITYLKNAFEYFIHSKEYQNDDLIAKELTDYGFKVVRVPSNIVRPTNSADINNDTHYISNFMNAIVHENKDGDLVYITNKSNLNKHVGIVSLEMQKAVGLDFEEAFKGSLKNYVKPENVYFVDGSGIVPELLENYQGGIHCMCAEVPKF